MGLNPGFGHLATVALGLAILMLAALVWRRSSDAARRPLAAFLLLVGLNQILDGAGLLAHALLADTGPRDALQRTALVADFFDPPVAVLAAWSLATGRAPRRAWLLPLAFGAAFTGLFFAAPPPDPWLGQWRLAALFVAAASASYLLAFAVLLRAWATETRRATRERLDAVLLALGVVLVPRAVLGMVDMGWVAAGNRFALSGAGLMALALAALYGATWAAALALHRRSRARPGPVLLALGLCDAAIAALWLLAALPAVGALAAASAYVVRWFLFAAIVAPSLRPFGLLEATDRGHAWVRGAFAGLVLVAVVAQAWAAFSALLASPAASLAAAAGTVAGAAAVLGALAFATGGLRSPARWRRDSVYRAHVEAGAAPGGLERIRRRLGLSAAHARRIEEGVRLEAELGPSAPLPAVAVGSRALGRYEVLEFLGAGGLGRIFRARDAATGRMVVLKEALSDWRGPDAAEAARREARALLAVSHPNVVPLLDLVRWGTGWLLVLGHVEGASLRAAVAERPLSARQARRVAQDVLAGLAALHGCGLVHGDVKPENIVVRPDGRAVLVDLGAAAPPAGAGAAGAATPSYAPPEAAMGRRLPQGDLWSAAACIWEAVAGRAPPAGTVPAGWAPVLRRAMHPDPGRRWASAEAMRQALPPR